MILTELAAEQEELDIIKRQLQVAKKEEELLKRRGEADELRHQISAQYSTNAQLRGMPNVHSCQKESRDKNSESKSKPKLSEIPKNDTLNDDDINIDNLRKSKKLRMLVKKNMKKLGLVDNALSDNSVNSDVQLDGKSGTARILTKNSKRNDSSSVQNSAESDIPVLYDSSDSSSSSSTDKQKKKKKNKKKKPGIRA